MKALKVLSTLLIVGSFQTAHAEKLTCYDRYQGPPAGVNVGELTVSSTEMVLKTFKPITNSEGTVAIPAGETINLKDRASFDKVNVNWGCFDGTDLEVVEDFSKSDAVRLRLKVMCDRHPRFEVYEFSLQCQ